MWLNKSWYLFINVILFSCEKIVSNQMFVATRYATKTKSGSNIIINKTLNINLLRVCFYVIF